jgi:hypothetical protein
MNESGAANDNKHSKTILVLRSMSFNDVYCRVQNRPETERHSRKLDQVHANTTPGIRAPDSKSLPATKWHDRQDAADAV